MRNALEGKWFLSVVRPRVAPVALFACLTAAACAETPAEPAPDAAAAVDAAAAADATDAVAAAVDANPQDAAATVPLGPPPTGLVVHEWATFTVFQAAATQAHVAGVQRHEEAIPAFVPNRLLGPGGEALPELVLAKLQTAGAWVRATTPGQIQVSLHLPKAVPIADWPPARAVVPAKGAMQALAGGAVQWRLQVDPDGHAELLEPPTDSLWLPLRQVQAAQLTGLDAAGKPTQADKFLFHRAVGRFEPPLRVNATKSAGPGYTVEVFNDGAQPITHAWLLHLHAGGGLLQPLHGGIPAKGSLVQGHTPKESPEAYFAKVQTVLAEALVAQGLAQDEAKALVATFTHNWLKTPGLRLVLAAPQAWADAWLPLTIQPAPASHRRVLLGRVELLTQEAEQELLGALAVAADKKDVKVLETLGFFAEAKLRRALAASKDAKVQAFCQDLVAKLSGAP